MEQTKIRRPTIPGEILKLHYMEPLSLTISDLAEKLCISRKHLSSILHGHAAISVDMALRLARAFSTSPELWLNLQRACDLWDAQQKQGAWKDVQPVLPAV